MKNLFKFIENAYQNNGGSYNLNTGEVNPKSGYMVSIDGFDRVYNINSELSERTKILELTRLVFEYLGSKKIVELFAEIGDRSINPYLGLWYNEPEGIWYIDVSENIKDRREAIQIGIDNDQIDIWDCSNNKQITLEY